MNDLNNNNSEIGNILLGFALGVGATAIVCLGSLDINQSVLNSQIVKAEEIKETESLSTETEENSESEENSELSQALKDYYSLLLETTPLNERAICWDDLDNTFYYGFKVEAALEVDDLVNSQNYTVDDACIQAMADISDKIYNDITEFTNNYTLEHLDEETSHEDFETAYIMHMSEINNQYK
jgi:hypothetical protein